MGGDVAVGVARPGRRRPPTAARRPSRAGPARTGARRCRCPTAAGQGQPRRTAREHRLGEQQVERAGHLEGLLGAGHGRRRYAEPSTSPASSVARRPAGARAPARARRGGSPAASAPRAAAVRSTVRDDAAVASTCLTVSATGSTGTTASAPARSAATTASTTRDRRQAAGGVVDEHEVDVGGQRGERAARRESCRSAPPATTTHVVRREQRRPPRRRRRRARRRRPGRRTGAARRPRTAWTSSGSPASSRSALGAPGPSRTPAAGGGDEDADGHVRPAGGHRARARAGRRRTASGLGWPAARAARRRRSARSVRAGRPKTSRPLAVVSTLVTRTATSLPTAAAGALDDDHRAVVEVADGLAGLLAGLEQQHRRRRRRRRPAGAARAPARAG